jgi:hypothetical protein
MKSTNLALLADVVGGHCKQKNRMNMIKLNFNAITVLGQTSDVFSI